MDQNFIIEEWNNNWSRLYPTAYLENKSTICLHPGPLFIASLHLTLQGHIMSRDSKGIIGLDGHGVD